MKTIKLSRLKALDKSIGLLDTVRIAEGKEDVTSVFISEDDVILDEDGSQLGLKSKYLIELARLNSRREVLKAAILGDTPVKESEYISPEIDLVYEKLKLG